MYDIELLEFEPSKNGVEVKCRSKCIDCPVSKENFSYSYPNIITEENISLSPCADRLKAYHKYQVSKLEALL